MKKLLISIGVALATVINAAPFFALNLPTNNVQQITAAIYPSYAPGLTLANGEKAEWGAGAALLYPVLTPMTLIGARADFLADEFWGANISLTLQLPIEILGVPVTPFALGGAMFPIEDIANETASVSGLVGAGAYATIWQPSEKVSLQVFFEYERWVNLNVDVYHPGVALTVKF